MRKAKKNLNSSVFGSQEDFEEMINDRLDKKSVRFYEFFKKTVIQKKIDESKRIS